MREVGARIDGMLKGAKTKVNGRCGNARGGGVNVCVPDVMPCTKFGGTGEEEMKIVFNGMGADGTGGGREEIRHKTV